MRIAQLSVHTNPMAALGGRETGGMNVYVRELAAELARLGYEVDIVTRLEGEAPTEEDIAPNLRLVRVPAGPAAPLEKEDVAVHLPEFGERFERLARERGYDLIHSHYWQSAVVGEAAASALGAPHVVMFHTLGEVKNRARVTEEEPVVRIQEERQAAATATAIVTASDHERGLLETYYAADPAKMHTVPCGVDLELFRPGDRARARAELGLPQANPVLLWVGRLEKLKGVDILIGAAAQLDERDLTLLIVGGDERSRALRDELAEQARAAGIGSNVRFEGAVPHETLPAYYRAADVCVVPSYYESFGLVAVEAMACGTPVVASRVGGLVSTVTDGVNGYLIPWRCPEPFAEKLEVLLNNPELRANFGRAARTSVERFRWRRVALEVATVYDRALAAVRGASRGSAFGKEAYEAAAMAGLTAGTRRGNR